MSRRSVIGKPACCPPCRESSNSFLQRSHFLYIPSRVPVSTVTILGVVELNLLRFCQTALFLSRSLTPLDQVTSKSQALQNISSLKCAISPDSPATTPFVPRIPKSFRGSSYSPGSDAVWFNLAQTSFVPSTQLCSIHGCRHAYVSRAGL